MPSQRSAGARRTGNPIAQGEAATAARLTARRIARQIRDQPVMQTDAAGVRHGRRAPRSSSSPCRRRSGIRAGSPCSSRTGRAPRARRRRERHRRRAAPDSARRSVLARPRVDVLLVARDAIARAHRAGVELAAMAVVVAHLDRLAEAARRIAAGARRASSCRSSGSRSTFHADQSSAVAMRQRAVAGRIAEQRRVVHLRRRDDLAGIHADRPDRTAP